MSERYNIVRWFQRGGKRVIRRAVSLAEAQDHCSNPQTNSRTCTAWYRRVYTQQRGEWFDGYERIIR